MLVVKYKVTLLYFSWTSEIERYSGYIQGFVTNLIVFENQSLKLETAQLFTAGYQNA